MTSVYQSNLLCASHEISEGLYAAGVISLRNILRDDHSCLTRAAWKAIKPWRRKAPRSECAADYLHSIGIMSDEEFADSFSARSQSSDTDAALSM